MAVNRNRFIGGFPENLVAVFSAIPTLGVAIAILQSEGLEHSGFAFLVGLGAFFVSWWLAELAYQLGDGRGGLIIGKGYGTQGIFAAWFALVVAKAAISLVLGIFIHYEYLHLLLHLDIFPLLTFVVALLRQRVAARTLEKAQWPINLALVLLLSYVSVGTINGFSPLPPSGYPARQSAYQLFELANSIPLLLLLWRLHLDAQKQVVISGGRIQFRGTDISERFRPVQIDILTMLASARQHGVNCKKVSLEGLPGVPAEKGCLENSYCKPSICNRYMKIYREVNDLRKRLEQLGIGTIHGPENKRDIGEQGWVLQCLPGVKLLRRNAALEIQPTLTPPALVSSTFHQPGYLETDNPSTERCRGEQLRTLPRLVSGAFFVLAVSTATVFDLLQLVGPGSAGTIAVFIISILLWLAPFMVKSPKGFVRTLAICGFLIQAGTLALTAPAERNAAFFLLVRGFALLLLSFMFNIRHFNNKAPIRAIRTASYGPVFWILWFYVIGLQVLRGHPVALTGTSALVDLPWIGILFFDRLLLIIVFAYSIGFIMNSPRLVSADGSGICINGRTVALAIGGSNATLLASFLGAPNKTLVCRDIVAADYPEEAQLCLGPCKSASCPAYQRIYKRVKEVREFLVVLDLGDIISPGKNSQAKESGWRLCLAEGVYSEDNRIDTG
jgi:hypothetical protein